MDSLTHQVLALTPPEAPSLSLSHASHHALNLTVMPAADGGAPILGRCRALPLLLLTISVVMHVNEHVSNAH